MGCELTKAQHTKHNADKHYVYFMVKEGAYNSLPARIANEDYEGLFTYIGQTDDTSRRMHQHFTSKHVKENKERYGSNTMVLAIEVENQDDANQAERYYIKKCRPATNIVQNGEEGTLRWIPDFDTKLVYDMKPVLNIKVEKNTAVISDVSKKTVEKYSNDIYMQRAAALCI